MSREDEALEPIGARFGSFFLYPKVETALSYNDNIYALPDKTEDGIVRVSPSFSLEGDFATTTTALSASLDRYWYFDQTTENRTDWNVGANAQSEIRRDTFAYLAAGHSQLHEDRGDPNAIYTSIEPVEYHLTELGAGIASDSLRVIYGVDASYRRLDYMDSRQIGGLPIENDTRDRDSYQVAGRIGYEFSPGYDLLARFSYETRDYDKPRDAAGFDRDNRGYRASVGVNFEVSRLLLGEVFVGYLERTYDDARFGKVDALLFGANLTWTPTQLTTLEIGVDRRVQETIAAGYVGFLDTNYSIKVEHELLRTLTLDASVRYGTNAYERAIGATVAARNDDVYGAQVGAVYNLNRNLFVGLRYEWTKRESTVALPGAEFNRNLVTAKVGLQF